VTEIDDSSFAAEVQRAGDEMSPVRVGLLFARELAYPELRPSDCLRQLEGLADQAQPALASAAGAAAALAEFLFETAGYRGNQADYSDPRNSYLNQVLERRLGLPITLSVLYLHLAGQLGIAASGVGLPGHFIVSAAGEDGPIYFDPFHGGRQLALADCAELVRASLGPSAEFDPAWLRPTPSRGIAARMLNNLRGFYVSMEDWPMSIGIVERLRVLQPREASHVRDLGILHYRNGAVRRAAELLTQYLTVSPTAPDVDAVRKGRDRLWVELARLN
jgi:regulator of sirC expression with transglutaminase-like and TPR domain